jgi:acyl carrier protein
MDTYERVKRILVQVLKIAEDEISPDVSIGDDLGADSMDAVELEVALEKEFGSQLHDEAAETGLIEMLPETTVQQVVNYINERIRP